MMSNKARLALAVMMISALAACKSGVKLDDKATRVRSARNRAPTTSRK